MVDYSMWARTTEIIDQYIQKFGEYHREYRPYHAGEFKSYGEWTGPRKQYFEDIFQSIRSTILTFARGLSNNQTYEYKLNNQANFVELWTGKNPADLVQYLEDEFIKSSNEKLNWDLLAGYRGKPEELTFGHIISKVVYNPTLHYDLERVHFFQNLEIQSGKFNRGKSYKFSIEEVDQKGIRDLLPFELGTILTGSNQYDLSRKTKPEIHSTVQSINIPDNVKYSSGKLFDTKQ